jgi:hypothetical protein
MLFDGIDGELAHTCSLSNTQTPFRGHLHLDDAESWDKGNRILPVLLHQIGHLFGLDHSSNPKSIMSPLFKFENGHFDEETILLDEDVRNLKTILGIEGNFIYFFLIQITNLLISFSEIYLLKLIKI